MSHRHDTIPLKELVVIEYMTDEGPHTTMTEWQNKTQPFAMQSCARQLWMGDLSDLSTIPEKALNDPAVTVRSGKEAYAYILSYFCGNRSIGADGSESEKKGESHIVSQLRLAWQQFGEKNPDEARSLQSIWEDLTHDMRSIRNNVASDIRPARYENAARYLSGQKGKDPVFIIGNVSRYGNEPDSMTLNLARTLGNNRKGRVSSILITHPDPKKAELLYQALQKEKAEGHLACEIQTMPFKEALEYGVLFACQSFVTYPMGKDESVDQAIINQWQMGGLNSEAKLVHMRGNPQLRNGSTALWKNAELENYYGPEDVKSMQDSILKEVREISKRVDVACDNCAISRLDFGKRPIGKFIGLPTKDFMHQSGLDRSGMSRSAAD